MPTHSYTKDLEMANQRLMDELSKSRLEIENLSLNIDRINKRGFKYYRVFETVKSKYTRFVENIDYHKARRALSCIINICMEMPPEKRKHRYIFFERKNVKLHRIDDACSLKVCFDNNIDNKPEYFLNGKRIQTISKRDIIFYEKL